MEYKNYGKLMPTLSFGIIVIQYYIGVGPSGNRGWDEPRLFLGRVRRLGANAA